MAGFLRQTYTGITAPVTKASIAAPAFVATHTLQVKGTGAAPTAWSVTLEGSLDGTNWTTLMTHTAADGSSQFADSLPVTYVRVNVVSLTLGGATDITVSFLSIP